VASPTDSKGVFNVLIKKIGRVGQVGVLTWWIMARWDSDLVNLGGGRVGRAGNLTWWIMGGCRVGQVGIFGGGRVGRVGVLTWGIMARWDSDLVNLGGGRVGRAGNLTWCIWAAAG